MGPANQHPPDPQRRQQVIQQSQYYSGPIPPPAVLKELEQITPGAAERIIKMAEKQQEHRHKIEEVAVRSGSRDSISGIVAAAVMSLGFLALAGYAISLGHTLAGVAIGTIDIAALASVFIYGTRSRRQEREGRFRQDR
jgi:uncharacterized membrane protein